MLVGLRRICVRNEHSVPWPRLTERSPIPRELHKNSYTALQRTARTARHSRESTRSRAARWWLVGPHRLDPGWSGPAVRPSHP